MFRLINRTTIAFFGFFLVAAAGLALYSAVFVWPRQQCESDGAWWDDRDRQCVAPIAIWRITGRPITAAQQNREHRLFVPPLPTQAPAPANK